MTTWEDAICYKDRYKGVAVPPYPARAGFLPAISDRVQDKKVKERRNAFAARMKCR